MKLLLMSNHIIRYYALLLLLSPFGASNKVHAAGDERLTPDQYPPTWTALQHCLDPTSPGGLLNTKLAQCKEAQTSAFGRDAKIAIVGAGAGGLTTAKLLVDRGFTDVTVFEKADRIGGKSYTKFFDFDPASAHEFGTCYLTGKYECVEAWVAEFGLNMFQVDTDSRQMYNDADLGLNLNNTNFLPTSQWSAYRALVDYDIPLNEFLITLQNDVIKYEQKWKDTFGDAEWMFQSDQTKINFTKLNCTFKEWLEDNDFTALIPRFIVILSEQGYGNIETIPAYYGLVWAHPNLVMGASWGKFRMIDTGFSSLWEALVAATPFRLELTADISEIVRDDKAVNIKWSIGTENNCEEFDFLFMAAPMPEALGMLDYDKNEYEVFGNFLYREYSLMVGELQQEGEERSSIMLSDDRTTAFLYNADDVGVQEDWFHLIFDEQTGMTTLDEAPAPIGYDGIDAPVFVRKDWVLYPRSVDYEPYSNKSVSVVGLIHSPMKTEVELRADVDSHFAAFNLTLDLYDWERWRYFPRYSQSDIVDAKLPWKVWDLQGRHRTFYVGSYVSFESIADILDYNLQLINTHLCDEEPTADNLPDTTNLRKKDALNKKKTKQCKKASKKASKGSKKK